MKKVVYTNTGGVNIHYLNIEGDKVVRYLVIGYDSFGKVANFSFESKNLDLKFYESNKNYKPEDLPMRTKTLLIKGLLK